MQSQGVSSPAYILAGAVFEECANHIKEYVEAFLTSILSEVKSSKSKWRDSYHDLIFEIYIRAPSLIIHLIPKLKDELLVLYRLHNDITFLRNLFYFFWGQVPVLISICNAV